MSLRAAAMISSLILMPVTALADTPYNDAIFVYEMNLKNVDIQLQGASAFAGLGNLPDVCKSLDNAVYSLDKALGNLDKAENAPANSADTARKTKAELDAARADVRARSAKIKTIISENCPAKS